METLYIYTVNYWYSY